MRKHQPLICLVHEIVWNQRGLILIWFVPRTSDPDRVRQVSSRLLFEFFEDRGDATSRVEDIIHDEKVVVVIGSINNVLQPVYSHLFALLIDAVIRARANRNVITL